MTPMVKPMTTAFPFLHADDRRREAFERLWEAERPRIWRLAARLSGNPDAADDLTQEIGIRALEAFVGFRGASAPSTWLFRIAVNAVLRWRERQARSAKSEVGESEQVSSREASPEAQTVNRAETERLHRVLNELPDELRTPLLLHVWEGLKYREIGAILEIPTGTVMSRLHSARQRLRKEWENDDAM